MYDHPASWKCQFPTSSSELSSKGSTTSAFRNWSDSCSALASSYRWQRREISTDTLELQKLQKLSKYIENSKFPKPKKKTEALLAHQLELTFPIDAQKFVAPANGAQTFFGKHQIFPPALFSHTGWAPTSHTWGSNPYKQRPITNRYITGVLTLLIGVVGPFTTGRGPSCIPSYPKLSKVRLLALCLVTRSRRRIRLQTSNQKSPKFQDLQSMMGPGENVANDPNDLKKSP